MSHRAPQWSHQIPVSLACVIALACAISGCAGEEERDYAIPRELCGYSFTPDDLAGFLPPGKEIAVRRDVHSVTTVCEVVIDRKLILTTTTTWRGADDSTESFARRALKVPKHSADGGRFRYSDFEAFGKTRKCVAPEGGRVLYTAVQAVGSKQRDADAMKRLITSFTAEVEASRECTAGVP
ncbi:hypothetical protein AB0M97_28720 [Streptomyces sp. NPDC051207]|uniref:hypothetical protein n=1 Tax=Streptomyces sp. NPDC051207 TaxID=3154641 RepID=UPI0034461E50